MKIIVEKIFGKEASEDKDTVLFYEDVNKLVMLELIQYCAAEFGSVEISLEDAESVLNDFQSE